MKLSVKFILIIVINFCCNQNLLAQNTPVEKVVALRSQINIPPLDVIIDSVLKNNAMLKFRKQGIGVKESTLESEKIYWTRNFGIQAETRYGTLNSFTSSADGLTQAALATAATQFNYSAGFYLKFPVFDFLNRKKQITLARLEVDQAMSMEQSLKDEIRQAVIKLYHDLLLKQKILKIRSESLGNGRLNMQMAEKEFRNGVIQVTEYSRISGITSNLEADYEFAKSEFLIAKSILEDMAGFKFSITN